MNGRSCTFARSDRRSRVQIPYSSFGKHESLPGHLLLREDTPENVRQQLRKMGYTLNFERLTSGPINAIYFDTEHGSFWGGSSNYGEDYGIAW